MFQCHNISYIKASLSALAYYFSKFFQSLLDAHTLVSLTGRAFCKSCDDILGFLDTFFSIFLSASRLNFDCQTLAVVLNILRLFSIFYIEEWLISTSFETSKEFLTRLKTCNKLIFAEPFQFYHGVYPAVNHRFKEGKPLSKSSSCMFDALNEWGKN